MNAHLFVLDTLADWEPGYAIAELNSGQYFAEPGTNLPVRTVGLTRDPVRTKGGVTIVPDMTIAELDPADSKLLILPGGDTWLSDDHTAILDAAKAFLDAGVPVAAICGATMALAEAGLLNDRPHTSNDVGALQMFCPGYTGSEHYVHEPAVTDGDLITATGVAPLEFAREILARLDVLSEDALAAWYGLNSTRDPKYYFALMEAVPEAE